MPKKKCPRCRESVLWLDMTCRSFSSLQRADHRTDSPTVGIWDQRVWHSDKTCVASILKGSCFLRSKIPCFRPFLLTHCPSFSILRTSSSNCISLPLPRRLFQESNHYPISISSCDSGVLASVEWVLLVNCHVLLELSEKLALEIDLSLTLCADPNTLYQAYFKASCLGLSLPRLTPWQRRQSSWVVKTLCHWE